MKLFNYYRSGTSHRIRIALHLKDVKYEYVPVNLLTREHKSEEYLAINPQGLAPSLSVDGHILTQSPAILEWIEETWLNPPLLPVAPLDRARVRAMAALIACDIHPLNNLRVLNAIKGEFDADPKAVSRWIAQWITAGFEALEKMLDGTPKRGGFCFGNAPGLAECCLIPQVYSAKRFGVDLTPFPAIIAIDQTCTALPAFIAAHPDNQPDAV